jgi:hypothetical protein
MGTRTRGYGAGGHAANRSQNGRCWWWGRPRMGSDGTSAPEREVLARMGTRTKGYGAAGLQNGWFWRRVGSRAGGLQRTGHRTGGSGVRTDQERGVMARARSRTRSSCASGRQNERFWGRQAPERVVLAACGFQDRGLQHRSQNGRFWRRDRSRTGVPAQARSGTRSSCASGRQNERFWGGGAPERVVLAACGFQGRGSAANRSQNGRF